MNILNAPKEEIEKKLKEFQNGTTDNLDLFFKIGKYYMDKYGTKKVNIHSKEGQEKIRQILFAMTEESFEFANTLKNKSWTQEDYPVDEEHMTEEVCDMFAFMIQLLLLLDFDSEKFKRIYISKLVVNDFRSRSNY
jgi:NTP pyrophosphatase (non-canonical NTP hydrolase)